jgi:sucrose phosphorylase
MLALEGIPAIYIHSFFATENDYQRLEHTSHNRSINRHQWSLDALENKLATPHSHHAKIFDALSNLLIVRRRQRAFHPNATQFTLHLGDHLFGFWRQSSDRMQSIFCIYNLTNEKHTLLLSQLNLIEMDEWHELVTGTRFDNLQQSIELKPYEYVWISNR